MSSGITADRFGHPGARAPRRRQGAARGQLQLVPFTKNFSRIISAPGGGVFLAVAWWLNIGWEAQAVLAPPGGGGYFTLGKTGMCASFG